MNAIGIIPLSGTTSEEHMIHDVQELGDGHTDTPLTIPEIQYILHLVGHIDDPPQPAAPTEAV